MDSFRKSSQSMCNGNCIEVGNDYRKSTSSISNGACIEVGSQNGIVVRDSTDRTGPVIRYTAVAWEEFITTVKAW